MIRKTQLWKTEQFLYTPLRSKCTDQIFV